ncbi:hypothetical protein FB45DRAFT_893676 [Roridomyces roridus]|uniref:Uncharacterized protein n=1 Tax=Roridomyces roridus TaxID=1738132 RepID=A0AAD7CFN0_9AGAR|nr:hypothetical protein FB45DRAFT_893676 [Roridomyces roridus]
MRDEFLQLLVRRYGTLKSQFPGEGRRKWSLRVLDEFWSSADSSPTPTGAPTALAEEFLHDDDPFDEIVGDGPQLGLLLRTDFSNEDAWQAFCTRLKSEEDEFIASVQPAPADAGPSTSADVNMPDGNADDEDDSDSDEESGGLSAPLIKLINPQTEQDRALVQNISNLRALRLLNDVDLRPAPTPPAGTKRYSPPNRLVDKKGWQEIYSGLTIWVYDAQSNTDQCARLVSQEGGVYGTATGDSWRAKASHLVELQFNMAILGMKIDFGGMDRYDYPERRRNLDEAEGS